MLKRLFFSFLVPRDDFRFFFVNFHFFLDLFKRLFYASVLSSRFKWSFDFGFVIVRFC